MTFEIILANFEAGLLIMACTDRTALARRCHVAGYRVPMQETSDISVAELRLMADAFSGELVKAVVDVAQDKLLVDMEYHVDGEQYLLSAGSRQEDLWGINLYPERFGTDGFVEFDSIINLRPRQNRSRGVDDQKLRQRILGLVSEAVRE